MIGNGRVPIGLNDWVNRCYNNWYLPYTDWRNDDKLLKIGKEGCRTADSAYMNTSNGKWYPQDPDDQTLLSYICEKQINL